MDIISLQKAKQALAKAGFIGTKKADTSQVKDGDIVKYSAELDKFVTKELRTKVHQWQQGHKYEQGEIVVFDDMLYWVLTDHVSHETNIEFDVANNQIIPFITEMGISNVLALDFEIQENGQQLQLSWVNPTDASYEGREVYFSDTLDITTMRYEEIIEATSTEGVQLLTDGEGTGSGEHDNIIVEIDTRKTYYVKAFAIHWVDGDYQHSSGRFLTLNNPDIYPPQAPTNLRIQVIDGEHLKLSWTQPLDEDFMHTRVVRSTTGFPSTPTDGTVLGSVNGEGEFIDTTVDKRVTYYYSLFAFDDAGNGMEHGVEGNHSTATQGIGIIYEILGFDFNTLERTEGAEFLEQEDFDGIYPWSDIKRAVVDAQGEVVYYLDEFDSNFKEDGTTPAVLDGTDGNVVVEYPQFYFKWEEGKFFVSQDEFTGSILIPRTLVGAFEGHKNETMGEMESIAGVKPTTGKSISEYRLLASGIGDGWQQTDIHFLNILKGLFAVEYGALNSQELVGDGIVTGTEERETGATLSLGNRTGVGTGGAVSYRGLENPWGNTWEFVEGLVITDTAYYVADTGFGNFVSDANMGDYKSTGIKPITEDGYISNFIGDGNFIADEVIGNSTLPIGDYQYSHKQGETNLAVHGGNFEDGNRAGIFRIHMGIKKFAVEEEMEFSHEFGDYTGNEFETTYESTGVFEQDMVVNGEEGQLYIAELPKSLNDEEITQINKVEIL